MSSGKNVKIPLARQDVQRIVHDMFPAVPWVWTREVAMLHVPRTECVEWDPMCVPVMRDTRERSVTCVQRIG